jgi:hypothetical protein
MLRGATWRAAAIVGTPVLRIVVSSDSMKNATAISHGSSRLLESASEGGEEEKSMGLRELTFVGLGCIGDFTGPRRKLTRCAIRCSSWCPSRITILIVYLQPRLHRSSRAPDVSLKHYQPVSEASRGPHGFASVDPDLAVNESALDVFDMIQDESVQKKQTMAESTDSVGDWKLDISDILRESQRDLARPLERASGERISLRLRLISTSTIHSSNTPIKGAR